MTRGASGLPFGERARRDRDASEPTIPQEHAYPTSNLAFTTPGPAQGDAGFSSFTIAAQPHAHKLEAMMAHPAVPDGDVAVSIEDRIAVYDLFVDFCEALDYRRWEMLDNIFTADCTSVWPRFKQTDRTSMIDMFRQHLVAIGPTHHLLGGNFRIRREGEMLVASVYFRAYHSGTGERANLFDESLGVFDGRARPTPDGWRFEHFGEAIFVVLGTYDVFGVPDVPGRMVIQDNTKRQPASAREQN